VHKWLTGDVLLSLLNVNVRTVNNPGGRHSDTTRIPFESQRSQITMQYEIYSNAHKLIN